MIVHNSDDILCCKFKDQMHLNTKIVIIFKLGTCPDIGAFFLVCLLKTRGEREGDDPPSWGAVKMPMKHTHTPTHRRTGQHEMSCLSSIDLKAIDSPEYTACYLAMLSVTFDELFHFSTLSVYAIQFLSVRTHDSVPSINIHKVTMRLFFSWKAVSAVIYH